MRRLWRGVVALSALGLASCGTMGSSSNEPDAPAIAVKRGPTWTSYGFALPAITGPSIQLQLRKGRLSGMLESGSVDVTIASDGAQGYGPTGPVNLTIAEGTDGLEVQGTWNGGPVNFVWGAGRLRGSVMRQPGRLMVNDGRCSVDLDRVDPRGALQGVSTCLGMPEETLLAIDPRVPKLVSRSEMVVIIVALFSAPPLTASERL